MDAYIFPQFKNKRIFAAGGPRGVQQPPRHQHNLTFRCQRPARGPTSTCWKYYCVHSLYLFSLTSSFFVRSISSYFNGGWRIRQTNNSADLLPLPPTPTQCSNNSHHSPYTQCACHSQYSQIVRISAFSDSEMPPHSPTRLLIGVGGRGGSL